MSLTYQDNSISEGERAAVNFGFTTGTSTEDSIMNALNAVGLITAPVLTLGISFMTNAFNPETSPFAINYSHIDNGTQASIERYQRYLASPEGQAEQKRIHDQRIQAYGAEDPWEAQRIVASHTPQTQMNWDAFTTDVTNRAIGTSLAEQGIAKVQNAARNQNMLQSMQKQTQIIQGRTADLTQASQAANANLNKMVTDVTGAIAQRTNVMAQQQQLQQQAQQQQQSLQQQQVQDAQTNLQQRTQAEIVQQQQRANALQQAQQLAQQRVAQNQPTLKQILTAPPRSVVSKAQVKV